MGVHVRIREWMYLCVCARIRVWVYVCVGGYTRVCVDECVWVQMLLELNALATSKVI